MGQKAHLVASSSVPLRAVRCAHLRGRGARRCAQRNPVLGVHGLAHKLKDLKFVREGALPAAAQHACRDARLFAKGLSRLGKGYTGPACAPLLMRIGAQREREPNTPGILEAMTQPSLAAPENQRP